MPFRLLRLLGMPCCRGVGVVPNSLFPLLLLLLPRESAPRPEVGLFCVLLAVERVERWFCGGDDADLAVNCCWVGWVPLSVCCE